MQITVLFEKQEGPWGGGNQFLKALQSQLEGLNPPPLGDEGSRFILTNSHHFGPFIRDLRAGIIQGHGVIHRVDGPLSSTRRSFRALITDVRILLFGLLVADGVVFQSEWSRERASKLGLRPKQSTVLHNAPDPEIFFPSELMNPLEGQVKRVIVTSWSTNSMKGFGLLEEIASSLIDEGFEFLFVGNSPRLLNNFVHLPPTASVPLAAHLNACDIYLSASMNDSCSNSLLEAIHCGLIPVVINSGGNPELVGVRQLLFETPAQAVSILREDLSILRGYAEQVEKISIREVAIKYLDFARRIAQNKNRHYRKLRFEVFVVANFILQIFEWISMLLERLRPFRT